MKLRFKKIAIFPIVLSLLLPLCSCGKPQEMPKPIKPTTYYSETPSEPSFDSDTDSDLQTSDTDSNTKSSDTDTTSGNSEKKKNNSSDTQKLEYRREKSSDSDKSSSKTTSSKTTSSKTTSSQNTSSSLFPNTIVTRTFTVEDDSNEQQNQSQNETDNSSQTTSSEVREEPVPPAPIDPEQPDNGSANTDTEEPYQRQDGKKLIVIDAGHQQHANTAQEPIGPGASETKMKVSGGTQGRTTGLPEYELTLQLALKLQADLESRGYEVIQVRTENNVDISNSERSAIANNAHADAFIRIHANGSENSAQNGAMTLCQTPNNPYNAYLYNDCKALSTYVLDELVNATGCNKEYVWETDTMSGINWSKVPVTIVEVGYMTNPQEDLRMANDENQCKITEGIANGIDRFFNEHYNQ